MHLALSLLLSAMVVSYVFGFCAGRETWVVVLTIPLAWLLFRLSEYTISAEQLNRSTRIAVWLLEAFIIYGYIGLGRMHGKKVSQYIARVSQTRERTQVL